AGTAGRCHRPAWIRGNRRGRPRSGGELATRAAGRGATDPGSEAWQLGVDEASQPAPRHAPGAVWSRGEGRGWAGKRPGGPGGGAGGGGGAAGETRGEGTGNGGRLA